MVSILCILRRPMLRPVWTLYAQPKTVVYIYMFMYTIYKQVGMYICIYIHKLCINSCVWIYVYTLAYLLRYIQVTNIDIFARIYKFSPKNCHFWNTSHWNSSKLAHFYRCFDEVNFVENFFNLKFLAKQIPAFQFTRSAISSLNVSFFFIGRELFDCLKPEWNFCSDQINSTTAREADTSLLHEGRIEGPLNPPPFGSKQDATEGSKVGSSLGLIPCQ